MSTYALFGKPSSGRPAPAADPAAAQSSQPVPRRLDAQKLHAAAVRQYEDPANSVRGTAARRQQLAQQAGAQQQSSFQWPWQQQQKLAAPPSTGSNASPNINNSNGITNNRHNTNSNSNANPLIPPHLPEQCPQCGARFATVERLVQHVEDFHPSAAVASSSTLSGAPADGAAAGQGPASAGMAAFFTNPLRGALGSTTIAGGAAPTVVAATAAAVTPQSGLLTSIARRGSPGGGDANEVYRCHFCALTFNDPVVLVRHSDRCAAANSGAAAAVAVRPGERGGGGGGGGGSAGSSSKDNCTIC
ncbi:hypothetical protein Vretimale_10115 [Volvox reticuliferus]|nr:hypothetical protein Vretimale_10115 [Volvox reticuliferus]